MKLHSPEFESSLEALRAAALRESPQLQRESMRAASWHERISILPFTRPFVSVLMGCGVWYIAKETGSLGSALAAITLAGLFFACSKTTTLLHYLYSASDLPVLGFLPVSDDTIFKWEFGAYARNSLWLLLDFVVVYAALAVYYQLAIVGLAGALVVAVLSWAMVMALSMIAAAHLPRAPYWVAALVMVILPVAVLYSESVRREFLNFLNTQAVWINALSPTGYVVWLFDLMVPPRDWWCLAMLAPVATLLWIGKRAFDHLRRNYCSPEIDLEQLRQWDPDHELEDEFDYSVAGTTETPVIEIEEAVAQRTFFAAPAWHSKGVFERVLWKWLNDRERVLAEFAFPDGIAIGASWVGTWKIFICTCLIWAAASLVLPMVALWLLGLGLFIGFCLCVDRIGGGRAFETGQVSGVAMARHSLYAIGYGELGRLIFKHATVQIPMLMAYTVAASLVVGYTARFSMEASLFIGVKAGGAMFAGTFLTTIFGFSASTNDTTLRWRNLVFLTTVLFCGIVEIGFGLAAFLSKNQTTGWVCWGLMIVNAYLSYRVYGFFYERNAFDSMRMGRG